MSFDQLSKNGTRQELAKCMNILPNGILARISIQSILQLAEREKINMTTPILAAIVTKMDNKFVYVEDGTGMVRLAIKPSVSWLLKRFIQIGSSLALVFPVVEVKAGMPVTINAEGRNLFAVASPKMVYFASVQHQAFNGNVENTSNGGQIIKCKPNMDLRKIEQEYVARKQLKQSIANPPQENSKAVAKEVVALAAPSQSVDTAVQNTSKLLQNTRKPLQPLPTTLNFGFHPQMSTAPVFQPRRKKGTLLNYFEYDKPFYDSLECSSLSSIDSSSKPSGKENALLAKSVKPKSSKVKEAATREAELGMLKNFDTDMTYGACCGVSRMYRYERALRFKLQPPPNPAIGKILKEHPTDKEYDNCVYDYSMLCFLGRK